jgi:NAD(P)-dependent dehydrogenase (short-subunit alcohol dehydrogenase family)
MPNLRPLQDSQVFTTMIDRKTIIVTGCNSGLGKGILLELCNTCTNCTIIYTCRTKTKIDELFSELPKNSSNSVSGVLLNLDVFESVQRFIQEIKDTYKSIDCLFLNAGIHKPGFFPGKTSDGIEIHLQVNFLSNALIILSLLDLMKNGCKISVVNSCANKPNLLNPWLYHYARSKRFILEFTAQISRIYDHITIKNIAPNFMQTDLHRYKPKFYKTIAPFLNHQKKSSDIAYEARRFLEITFDPNETGLFYEFGERNELFIKNEIDDLTQQLRSLTRFGFEFLPTYNRFNVLFFCKEALYPKTVEEIQEIVLFAKNNKRNLRVNGSKQSYNDIFMSDDLNISLDKMSGIIGIEKDLVTVQAGCKLYDLLMYLYQHDFDLEIMPSNVEGAIAGLTSTGAHCHYTRGGVFSELVAYMEIIDGNGILRKISSEDDLKVIRSVAGMLGVITLLKLRIQPKEIHKYKFNYKYVPYSVWKKDIKKYMTAYDHVRYYWLTSDPDHISMDSIHPSPVIDPNQEMLSPKINYLEFIDSYKKKRYTKAIALSVLPYLFSLGWFINASFKFFQKTIVTRYAPFKTLLFCNFFSSIHYFVRTVTHEYGNLGEWCVPVHNASAFLDQINALFKEKYSNLDGLVIMFRFCGSNQSVLLSPTFNEEILYIEIKTNISKKNAQPLRALANEITELGKEFSIKYHMAKHNRAEKFSSSLDKLDLLDAYRKDFDPQNTFSNEWTRYHFNH